MVDKIEVIEEILKMAKMLKADYAEIGCDNKDYRRFIFVWDKT